MALYDAINAVKQEMVKVDNIGVVHSYERWADTWPKFLEYFSTIISGKKIIRGWTVTRTATSEERITNLQNNRTYTLTVRGYHGLSDADQSEVQFQKLIEAICDHFRPLDQLVAEPPIHQVDPPQVRTVELRIFGEVLCHYAELIFTLRERLTRR